MNIDRVIGRANYLVLPALCLAAFGCAGNTASPVDARAAGEWTFRLPETRSPYAALAIDRGGPAIAQNDQAKSVLDDSAVSAPATGLAVAPVSKAQPKARAVVAKARAEQPTTLAATTPPPASTAEIKVQEPEQLAVQLPATTSNDAERYSGREAKSEKQRDYRGGDAIVISASALVIILLVVVLILLLT